MKRILAFTTALLTLGSAQAHAQAQAQQTLAFVTCPMLRDTATVPCWLAAREGDLYYLDIASDAASPPSLGHQALIEGTPTTETRCGGKVLTNLRVSVLPDRDLACETILPATDAFQITGQPAGPVQAAARPPVDPASLPLPNPTALGSQMFEVLFDFDGEKAGPDAPAIIQQAVAYAKANPMAEVRAVGYRAAVQLTGGKVLEEQEGIDIHRARQLLETLVTLGLDRGKTLVIDNPIPELGDHTRRRAAIEVVLSGSDDHSEH